MLGVVVRIAFCVFLALGVPALSWRSARPQELAGIPKPALYLSAVVSQWVLALIGAVVVIFSWPRGFTVGFRPVAFSGYFRWTLLVTGISLVGLAFFLLLEHWGLWPEESEVVRLLMPENGREKMWALLGLAPTAGVCEEFLYRGFLLTEATAWLHSALWGVVISSVVFGLAHVYQGINGIVRAALLGALLALPVVQLGSLYPSMTAHFLIDAVALLWLGPKFLESKRASDASQ